MYFANKNLKLLPKDKLELAFSSSALVVAVETVTPVYSQHPEHGSASGAVAIQICERVAPRALSPCKFARG
jgi:hypothetical protein